MKERICVCGLGKVGRPILENLRAKGFWSIGYDCAEDRTEVSLENAIYETDAAIFIVPTPSLLDGSFSNEYLTTALTRFKREADVQGKSDYLFIVSSTTTPGSCERFRAIVGDNLVYKPEFIRLEHVMDDLRRPHLILIGHASESAASRALKIYLAASVSDSLVAVCSMSLTEAELAKITLNCALTMKISLANQLHLVAQKMGCDSSKIMEAVGFDPRIGPGHLKPGWPYAGPCLPRDNRMFQFVAERVGIKAWLSEAADKINEAMK